MTTLLTTNILLAVIVLCIVVLTTLVAILLTHSIGVVRRVKYIVKTFDDDVHRARSVVLAIKEMIADKLKKK